MRREIIGILLFFLVIFTLISILSYSPADPAINHSGSGGQIHNLFGLIGAYLAGMLIGLFGIGSFWIPVLLLLLSLHFFGGRDRRLFFMTVAGGLLLVITTGSLLCMKQDHFILFDHRFVSGGLVGTIFKAFLIKYSNPTGAMIILALIWVIGFIMTTGFSLVAFSRWLGRLLSAISDKFKTVYLKRKERREKAKKRRTRLEAKKGQKKPSVKIKTHRPKPIKELPAPKQEVFTFMQNGKGFKLPSIGLLNDPKEAPVSADNENLKMQSKLLEKKLDDFGVKGEVVTVLPGPIITTFEYAPAAGVKINKIVTLADDLALALRAISIRIVAPIPGKSVIGIEIPNTDRLTVNFKEVVSSSQFEKSNSKLTMCLGKDVIGEPVVAVLDKMPHLLIAGATGTGKSVALNSMICSFLYKSSPDEVKLIMIDPKRIELSSYDGIPHLVTSVVTDAKKATNALYWAVREMERRYELLSEKKARNISQYNKKITKLKKQTDTETPEKLPFIVVIVDELADLMMVASRDVEVALTRLAQMARAAGIHLILATQRPSVDVLTGIIKANFPTRLTFQVSSKTDSRTIIDMNGAESLLGSGDMLFLPPGAGKIQRIHGSYISEEEVGNITEFLKKQRKPDYDDEVTEATPIDSPAGDDSDYDEKYDDAVALVVKNRQASISMIQRHLRVGYNRAARIIETMEKEGVVGPADGSKPREVLVRGYDDMS
jgi:S-DNA-T family DNA segregation ATPase FtsK/SpoIIIE